MHRPDRPQVYLLLLFLTPRIFLQRFLRSLCCLRAARAGCGCGCGWTSTSTSADAADSVATSTLPISSCAVGAVGARLSVTERSREPRCAWAAEMADGSMEGGAPASDNEVVMR